MLCNYSHGVELFQLERKNKSLWPIEAKDLWNNEYEPTNSKHVHNDHQTKGRYGIWVVIFAPKKCVVILLKMKLWNGRSFEI